MTTIFLALVALSLYLIRYTLIILPRKATERLEFEADMLARRNERKDQCDE